MRRLGLLVVTWLATSSLACESTPVSPTVIPAAAVPSVSTAQPYVWDSRDELAAWVANGVTTGAATVAGDDAGAVIRVDVSQGDASLHGPDLNPPLGDAWEARIRYRWLGRGDGDVLFLAMYLRPPAFDASFDVPRLRPSVNLTELDAEHSGAWVERRLLSDGSTHPPYATRFALVSVTGSGSTRPAPIHGAIEIDWIAIVR